MLKFITSNKGKFGEISQALSPIKLKMADISLDEIQDMDRQKVLRHKVLQALKHHTDDFFVEDTCVYFSCFKGKLPGPFIKFFIDELGIKSLYEMCHKLGDTRAEMVTNIAYAKNKKQIYYFEGKVKGKIVKPKGEFGFGMDPIFVANGLNKTFGELKGLGSVKHSARYKAAIKLRKHLQK